MNKLERQFGINTWLLLIFIVTINSIILYLTNLFILNYDFYLSYIESTISTTNSELITNNIINFQKYRYIILPIFLLLKIFTLTVLLYTYVHYSYKIALSNIFGIIVFTEFSCVIYNLLKLSYFTFFAISNINEYEYFSTILLLLPMNLSDTEYYIKYPLSYININELLYISAYIYFLKVTIVSNFRSCINIILISYITPLIIWIIIIEYLLLTIF